MKGILFAAGILLNLVLNIHSVQAGNPFNPSNGFFANRNQFHDQNGAARNDVKYIYYDHGFRLILKENGWAYEWIKPLTPATGEDDIIDDKIIPAQFSSERIDVELLNCNQHPILEATDSSAGTHRRITVENGIVKSSMMECFSKVIYHDVYPNIDLEFEIQTKNGSPSLKYSFVVHEGGSPSNIKLAYGGLKIPDVTNNKIQLSTAYGSVVEHQPIYATSNSSSKWKGGYQHSGNIISFNDIPKWNETLILDPEIEYGTYMGGNGVDVPENLILDEQGNIYVSGSTGSTDFPITSGAYQNTFSGGEYDVFLLKFSPSFILLWSTYFGGNETDKGWTCAVDASGSVYLGGESASQGLATPGAEQSVVNGTEADGIIAKFSSGGELLWCRYFGGSGWDELFSLHIAKNHDLLIAGYTESADSISTPGSFQETFGGFGDGFLARLDSNGHTLWSTYFGEDGQDRFHDVNEDESGRIIASGTSPSSLGTAGSHQPLNGGMLDAVIARFTSSGSLLWCTMYGGDKDERGREVVTDENGNIYVNGWTQSTKNIATPTAWDTSYAYGLVHGQLAEDAFLVKFDSNGVRQWGTYFGGTKREYVRGLTINKNDDLYWLGITYSSSDIVYGQAYQYNIGGVSDVFISKWDKNGILRWSSYYGGAHSEGGDGYGEFIQVKDQDLYFASSTMSSDSISTSNAYMVNYSGYAQDVFIVKLHDLDSVIAPCADNYEPNNSFTQATLISSGTVYNAKISSASDKDYFKFSVLGGTKYLIKLTNLPADYDFYVYDSLEHLVGSSKKAGLVAETKTLLAQYNGSYFLKVIGKKNPPQFNDSLCYSLQVTKKSPKIENEFLMPAGDQVTFYPDPAHDYFTIKFSSGVNAERYTISVVDELGRVRWHGELNEADLTTTISTEHLSPGIYFVILSNEKNRMSRRIVIQ